MYNKTAFTIDEQIVQLKNRGLLILDSDNAEHFLSHISYYRLAGYWWPMQQEHKKKHPDDERFPPSWKSLEMNSLGALSKIYGNLKLALMNHQQSNVIIPFTHYFLTLFGMVFTHTL